jgi:two-component system sensor histidine kinase KdpD
VPGRLRHSLGEQGSEGATVVAGVTLRGVRHRLRSFALSPVGAYVVSGLGLAAATAVLLGFRSLFGVDVVALLLVPVIIASAGAVGRRGWWFTPSLAFLALNFFFAHPYYSLNVADPHDLLLLVIFLAVGLVSSIEVGRLRQRTREATGRQHDLLVLNRLSRDLVSEASTEDVARIISTVMRDSAERLLLLVSDSGSEHDLRSVTGAASDIELSVARWVFVEGKAVGLPAAVGVASSDEPWPISVEWPQGSAGPRRGVYLPLQSSAGRVQGVLLVEPIASLRPAADRMRLFVSVANLVAAFLERHQLQLKAMALASLEEADRLKSSFISGISHDIKTPLAAAKARVTGLLEDDVPREDERQREDLTAVAANLDRLDVTIGDLLDLSRLESDAWRPHLERHEVGEILSTMLSRLPSGGRERIDVSLPQDPVLVTADFRQMERAVRNLVENALAYSDGQVHVTIVSGSAGVGMTVEDRGPGIPLAERERVFDPFFRGSTVRRGAAGSGLGLAITREIVRAHEGTIRIEDVEPTGTRFVISLPNEEKN